MAPSSFRKAIGAVKDTTSIGLAKVGSSTSLADLDVAIVKATRHNEYPAEEKYLREILSLTCYSRVFISACVNTISRRLSKTRSWTVALKSLVLIQRLLAEGDPAYEQEIFFSTRRGTRLLNMSDFRDHSRSGSWDFSAFVRTYALYLDERLDFKMQSRRGRHGKLSFDDDVDRDREVVVRSTPVKDMTLDKLYYKMHHLQLLLERFLACRPTGAAKDHRIVIVALYPIVRESFQLYYDITEILGIFLDRFPEMEAVDCSKVYDIFCRVGKQFDELDVFYIWSKNIGIARFSEYPEIEKITPKKLEIMEEFIKGKLVLPQNNQQEKKEVKAAKEPEPEPEEDMNAIKALPPPEASISVAPAKEEPKKEPEVEKPVQMEANLLNLGDETVTCEDQGDKLALALFDGALPAATGATQALPWHAFDEAEDWETALVQSGSNLSNQKPALGGGFDTLVLNGMYQRAEMTTTMQGPGYGVSGSASSVALGSAGRPAVLALPAPPTPGSGLSSGSVDPFAASLSMAPPSYVQMSEIEKKQKLLLEEQLMWQQFEMDRSQGQAAFLKQQHQQHNKNPYFGGYPQNYGNYQR
ncbi:putative clathrin assembly protein At1g03050 [Arachis duranensis]|uniref:Clathrin assembly protein At1g03050 n=1 Tax=Arachis duranensis TaxID=130453 RepID=A0A9C6TB82_ARADU|nr:putative clathrin assembly protein At1g03050 [Arachis duranensis]